MLAHGLSEFVRSGLFSNPAAHMLKGDLISAFDPMRTLRVTRCNHLLQLSPVPFKHTSAR